jgi:hypothetical protein
MSRFGDAFRGVKGWIGRELLGGGPGMDPGGPGGPGIGPLDPTVMDPRMGPGMGPGMMDPEMGAYPGTVQQPPRQAMQRGGIYGATGPGPGPPLPEPSPWDDTRGGGWGDYLTSGLYEPLPMSRPAQEPPPWYAGDAAQLIGGGLGAGADWLGSRMDRQSEEERIALEREKYNFQKQKHADERADRAAMHGRGSSGPIKWRQY